MSPTRWMAVIILGAAVGLFALSRLKPSVQSVASHSAPQGGSTAAITGSGPKGQDETVLVPGVDQTGGASFGSGEQREDYAERIALWLPRAAAGDPEAQYLIGDALHYCARELRRFFLRPGRQSFTLDEALVAVGRAPEAYHAYMRVAWDRCQAFLPEHAQPVALDSARTWLERAAEAGQPRAQALLAEIILDGSRGNQTAQQGEIERAHGLLVTAVASGDPIALERASTAFPRRSGESDSDFLVREAAWRLAMCERGADCAPTAHWRQQLCMWDPLCPPSETMDERLHRTLDVRAADARALAQEIVAAVAKRDESAIRELLGIPPRSAGSNAS